MTGKPSGTGETPGSVLIRAYAGLNDFLPAALRHREFPYPMTGGNNLKHLVESAGIPHTEIDLIIRNGSSAGFETHVAPGDRISIYPAFAALELPREFRLRPEPPDRTSFVLDVHLGKLAVILRLLGFDALFPGDVDDGVLAGISASEGRILLTCDRMLLKRGIVVHGCCIRSRNPVEQAREVLDRFDIRSRVRPFGRCASCSGLLEQVSRESVLERLQPLTRLYYHEFRQCSGCGAVYWKGSHYPALSDLLCSLGVQLC